MQTSRLFKIVFLASVATLAPTVVFPAKAVTLNIFGTSGINGLDGVGAPGTDGGPGGAASAVTTPNVDPSNTANATAGNGGAGDVGFNEATVAPVDSQAVLASEPCQRRDRPCCAVTQSGLEFGKRLLDRIEVRRVGRRVT